MKETFVFSVKKDTRRVEVSNHWKYCVGSGQAKLAMRSDYARQLKFIHDELGIERVRFHGIFDDDMQAIMSMADMMPMPGAEKFQNYNFFNIFAAYDNVLAAGMKPWVELSFMPSTIAKRKKKVTVNAEGMKTMPAKDDDWVKLVQAFIRAAIHRYGRNEVITWNFEVWNEPNMFTFFAGTMEDYFHLYEITAKAVKEVEPALLVGGPASATGDWIAEFIDFCEQRKLPLDFISTHNYPGDGIGEAFAMKDLFSNVVGGMKQLRSKKAGTALDGIRLIMEDKTETTVLAKGQMYDNTKKVSQIVAGRYPIYYTEWNCNAILTSPSNDSKKVACFQVKSIDEMEGNVTGSSIWAFSDIFDEFMIVPEEFSGGFGLLTIHGIPKPQFYALKLLSDAGSRKLVLPRTNDEIELSVYESDDEYRVFVYRQRMKGSSVEAEKYRVQIEVPGCQNVRLYRIDDEHCNPYRIWKEMGSPENMNPQEIHEVIEKSSLVAEKVTYTYENGELIVSGRLQVNDTHCYIIRK